MAMPLLLCVLTVANAGIQKLVFHRKKLVDVNKLLVISGCLLTAIACVQYGFLWYKQKVLTQAAVDFHWWEALFEAVIRTLRVFVLEESYTEAVEQIREIAPALWQNAPWWFAGVCSFFVSALWFGAPIAGGAIILEILLSIFPVLRLWGAQLLFFRPKLYFNCLNEASVTLVEGIRKLKGCPLLRPICILTDVQMGQLSEQEQQLQQKAARCGAICVRDDLVNVSKNLLGNRQFFLISESSADNLQALIGLTDRYNYRFLAKSDVHLFCQNDTYVRVEALLREKLKELGVKEQNLPRIMPVHVYKKLITKMLVDVPLYEPLLHKEPDADGQRQLTVTILGNGAIGTEMLLTTYWMGQLLDCKLQINVISQDDEQLFWGKLDAINTELRRSMDGTDKLLKIASNCAQAPTYCSIRYIRCDVHGEGFIGLLQEAQKQEGKEEGSLLDTDYFFVSLGSDEVNLELADVINRYVGQHHIHHKLAGKTVISYVIYDDALAKTLNRKMRFSSCNDENYDIYMQAVGNLGDVYCADNVYRVQDHRLGFDVPVTLRTLRQCAQRGKAYDERIRDDYSYWSSRARGLHTKYKMFSGGFLTKSVFDCTSGEYEEAVRTAFAAYKLAFADGENAQLGRRLAWLEHRRWNAYLRTCGFRCPEDHDVYTQYAAKDSYKQMDLKLHPCLVECDYEESVLNQIKIVPDKNKPTETKKVVRCPDCTKEPWRENPNCPACEKFKSLDGLDRLSLQLQNSKQIYKGDFKYYDYPDYENSQDKETKDAKNQ